MHTLERDASSLEGAAAGSWSLGIVEQSQGEGCWWLRRDWSRGVEGGDCGGKCLWRKAGQLWKQGSTAASRVGGGAITIGSLSPHASICSWTTERLTHQTPDTLNYKAGPHPGCPFKCLMCQYTGQDPIQESLSMCRKCRGTTEKDPRQGSHLSAWMGGALGKDWPKRHSDCQLQEAWKKTLIRP